MLGNQMTKRIFLDVGANTGQTLAAVLDPEFRFDEIYCFEPVKSCWKELQNVAEKYQFASNVTVRIVPWGLWNQNGDKLIIEPGSLGGSIFKKNKSRSDATELCRFVRASEWFAANIEEGNTVFLKLNCEGAECDIIDDLLDSGQFGKVTYMMVDFDVRKIASQKHRQAEIMARFETAGIKYPRFATSKEVMRGATHQDRIKNWLRVVEK